MIDITKIKVGDIIVYQSNSGVEKTRIVGKIHPLMSQTTVMVADRQEGFHYHVYENDISKHYSKENDPEYFL